ncbi:MAG: biotin-dependent carboxyltransferase family protein [Winogradskyella sp.]|uniref:5-oxoprolinase subunit C family protein n=1 Tax=Winogradskyella sp. TaxID=1883156 RepID=UPI0017CD2CC1|nr:biotin-dependent carboxyltransferase family protein [Winogradskyella sp.]MBT8245757.1 biotin-dependent carboxyltransferase family protein [Winogradskyella sp.]NNK21888.1 biotin-dependent carboxyltransferase family protein [Winogradskyella sp.]
MIEVLKSGMHSSIQDAGRFGYRELGVPISGVMDKNASDLGNALLDNSIKAAVLEMIMIGAKLKFHAATFIVISGANMSPKLNDIPQVNNKAIAVNTGDILSFGAVTNGLHCYLAVKGGFKTEIVLGSKSYYYGITKYHVIKANEILSIDSFSSSILKNPQYSKLKSYDFSISVLNVFKGPEFDLLSYTEQKKLLNSKLKVSKLYNRMAYQLCPNFENDLNSILTGPVLPGTVQLTPSGKLIVLMRDCQTTGGYPRVLQLSEASINLLAQKKERDSISFRLKE